MEKHPCEHHVTIGDTPCQNPHIPRVVHLVKPPLAKLVYYKSGSMQGSPDDKHPRGTMPQASHKHGDKIVDIGAYLAFTVATKGNIYIVAKPCG